MIIIIIAIITVIFSVFIARVITGYYGKTKWIHKIIYRLFLGSLTRSSLWQQAIRASISKSVQDAAKEKFSNGEPVISLCNDKLVKAIADRAAYNFVQSWVSE